jgi:hypothetical protein
MTLTPALVTVPEVLLHPASSTIVKTLRQTHADTPVFVSAFDIGEIFKRAHSSLLGLPT